MCFSPISRYVLRARGASSSCIVRKAYKWSIQSLLPRHRRSPSSSTSCRTGSDCNTVLQHIYRLSGESAYRYLEFRLSGIGDFKRLIIPISAHNRRIPRSRSHSHAITVQFTQFTQRDAEGRGVRGGLGSSMTLQSAGAPPFCSRDAASIPPRRAYRWFAHHSRSVQHVPRG